MIWYPDVEDIEIMHAELLVETGGSPGLRDRGALESAAAQPQAAFGGIDLYPSMQEKATALCFSLAKNHPFVDGNKRTAHAATLLFLRRNRCAVAGDVDEHERVILALASSELTRQQLLDWFRDRVIQL